LDLHYTHATTQTTLVNYILKEQREWKICVLENEFGEVSIDDGLGM
jgi:G3E family GTPase